MNTNKFVMVLLMALLLSGCAVKASNYTYHSNQELPEGKGLFSGEDGEFILYKK